MLMGAVNRPEIIKFALLVPPIMAAAMALLGFLLVGKIFDWKCAIFVSGLIAIMDGQYFFRSIKPQIMRNASFAYCLKKISLVEFRFQLLDFSIPKIFMH